MFSSETKWQIPGDIRSDYLKPTSFLPRNQHSIFWRLVHGQQLACNEVYNAVQEVSVQLGAIADGLRLRPGLEFVRLIANRVETLGGSFGAVLLGASLWAVQLLR